MCFQKLHVPSKNKTHGGKKMKSLRTKITAGLMSMVMMFSLLTNVCHAESLNQNLTIDGINYRVTKTLNDKMETVINVESEKDSAVVVSDGDKVTVTSCNSASNSSEPYVFYISQLKDCTTNTLNGNAVSSPYWNYYCDNIYIHDSGCYYWILSSGHDHGGHSYYDKNDSSIISYSESFRKDVLDMNSEQNNAILALSVATAGIIAGAISGAATLSASIIIGIVTGVGGSLTAAGYFISAWNISRDANYIFDRIKSIT